MYTVIEAFKIWVLQTTDPLRIFYTTTFEQIAALKDNNGRQRNSEMSEKW